jgi:hypothetical protein
MIWNSIIGVIIAVLGSFIAMFPDVDTAVLDQINGGLAPFKSYLSNAGWLFPVQQFFTIIGIVIVTEGIFFAIKVIHWLIKNISAGFVK